MEMSNYPNKLSYREFKLKNIVRSGKGPFEFGRVVRYEDGREVPLSSFLVCLGEILICICAYFKMCIRDRGYWLHPIDKDEEVYVTDPDGWLTSLIESIELGG